MSRLVSAGALLALATLALAPFAHAVTLADDGIGEALIYPYYTVNNSQDTLVSLVNASDVGKAVQVRFLEGHNGVDVLDIVVFLGAHDAWTASASFVPETGGAVLRSSDTSCTLPPIPAEGVPFTSANYDGSAGTGNNGGPYDISRLREGSINMIAGGDIAPGTATDAAIEHPANFFNGTAAPNCGSIDPLHFRNDLVAPTEGVYGSGTIIDVGIGTFFAYNAVALADFTRTMVFDAYPIRIPGLEDANSGTVGLADAVVFDEDGRPIHLVNNYPIDAINAVLSADAVYNEYFVDPALGASTDWVVTLPMKHYYFANGAPVIVHVFAYDREEGGTATQDCGEFACDAGQQLSYEVNVIGVEAALGASGVFGSTLNTLLVAPYGASGWIKLVPLGIPYFGSYLTDADGQPLLTNGEAIIGFMAYNIINANAEPGQLANYGGAFRHHTTFSCQGPCSECSQPLPPPLGPGGECPAPPN